LELSRQRSIVAFVVVIPVAAILIYWWSLPRETHTSSLPIPGAQIGTTVEVLNGTLVDGLARTLTGRLRRAGIDVVYFGSARQNDRDSTVILVRRGDSTVADPIRAVLGTGRIVLEPDSLLLLDVTVLLGRDLAGARGISP
jgi:hypothetical protein